MRFLGRRRGVGRASTRRKPAAAVAAIAAVAALITGAAWPGEAPAAALNQSADEQPAPAASGFLIYKLPQGQPACTGVGLNVSANPHFSRDDCGFVVFQVSEAAGAQVTGEFYGPGADEPFAVVDAIDRGSGEFEVDLLPTGEWPAGLIRLLIKVNGQPAGEVSFGHNLLAAVLSADSSTSHRPGDDISVTGTISQLDTTLAPAPSQTPVPATFSVRVVTPEGTVTPVTNESGEPRRFTAEQDGTFVVTVPGELTAGVEAGADTNYQATVAVQVYDAGYEDAATGQWAAAEAGAAGVTLSVPPDGLVLENSFVSAVGWVKPGEQYPARIFVRNYGAEAVGGVQVTMAAPAGTSFLDATPLNDSGDVAVGPTEIVWTLGSVAGAISGAPTVHTLVVQAQAHDFAEEPQVVWKNLSSTATLTYDGGPVGGVASNSHGPKVIPPSGSYDTARYGDRPFPVVPVDFFDRKHQETNSGAELADVINSPDVEGSTFNLFQEMSLGQLFPNGDVPSAGVATRGFEYEEGFDFTDAEPAGTCHGFTVGEDGAGTPPYSERIQNGFYQLPGTTDYYGDDKTGSALVGAVTGVGLLFDIDSACGPTGKMVYDAAQIADPEIDYSDFDTDKDGVVDFFMAVYVGCGGHGASQVPGNCPYDVAPYDNVWPHSSSLEFYYSDPETGLQGYISDDQLEDLQGQPLYYVDASRTQMTTEVTEFPVYVRVGPYNVNPETSLEAASVISHEYGHSLGLPDFYSLGNRSTYGDWNLMATDKSQHMDIFSRQELGWVVPRVLEPGQHDVTGWTDSKEDTHRIDWQTPDGQPYSLTGPDVHNSEAYVAELPARQVIDPAKFSTGDGASLSHAWWSGSGNDFGCAPSGGHNLDLVIPGLADLPDGSQVTLEFKSLWDIEWDFDYGFVMTSTDAGQTYQSLPSQNGYTTPQGQNPNANSCQAQYGNGLTGSSGSYQAGTADADRLLGSYPDPVFLTDSYDLSSLAGQDAVLRFSYATDAGLARPAWFIDDLTVTATMPDGQQSTLLSTDFESDGDPSDPRVFNGGCKGDTRVAGLCTDGWNYISATEGSPADHAYYLELRDRSGFDLDGKGQNDRGPINFLPGLSLVYTDEAHGYGNVGTDNPPAQTPLDSQPEPGNNTPNLNDAAWTGDAGDNMFSDSGEGHTDNYTDPSNTEVDPRYPGVENPWRFRFGCLGFDVLEMTGTGIGPVQPDGDLSGAVRFNIGSGCGEFDYGYGDVELPDDNTPPVAVASASPGQAWVGQQVNLSGHKSTDAETPRDLDYSWDLDGDGSKDASGVRVRHTYHSPGSHQVTLTVTDPMGGTATDTVTVVVRERQK